MIYLSIPLARVQNIEPERRRKPHAVAFFVAVAPGGAAVNAPA